MKSKEKKKSKRKMKKVAKGENIQREREGKRWEMLFSSSLPLQTNNSHARNGLQVTESFSSKKNEGMDREAKRKKKMKAGEKHTVVRLQKTTKNGPSLGEEIEKTFRLCERRKTRKILQENERKNKGKKEKKRGEKKRERGDIKTQAKKSIKRSISYPSRVVVLLKSRISRL